MGRSSRLVLRVLATVALVLAPALTRSGRSPADDAVQLERELLLVVGEQQVVDAADVASFSESTRGVIEVKIPRDGKRMVITAVRPGRTSLLLISRGGAQRNVAITVFAERPEAIEAELRDLLADQPGLRLRRIGPRIFVDGTVGSEAALARVERVSELYPGQVSSLALVNQAAVQPRTNIRLDLTFVELRASSGWSVGVDWPSRIGDTGGLTASYDLLTGTPAASYQVVDQALPSLEAAARRGWVRIRKRATLVTTSGNRASYSAGGEVNVAIAGSQAAELRTVPYGCQLAVLPRLEPGPGILDLEVEAEVSDLTETSQDVPGRTISKVATLVHLGLGQSIVLSGLDAESESHSKRGLPLLSRIPIIGYFFGVGTHREEQVDGLIAITPTVIENLDRDGRRRLEEALARFEEFDGDFDE